MELFIAGVHPDKNTLIQSKSNYEMQNNCIHKAFKQIPFNFPWFNRIILNNVWNTCDNAEDCLAVYVARVTHNLVWNAITFITFNTRVIRMLNHFLMNTFLITIQLPTDVIKQHSLFFYLCCLCLFQIMWSSGNSIPCKKYVGSIRQQQW